MKRYWIGLAAIAMLMPTAMFAEDTRSDYIPMLDLALRKHIQTELKRQGYYAGAVDGRMGVGSKAAIERFRKAKGINELEEGDPLTMYLTPKLAKALLKVDAGREGEELDEAQQLALMRKLGVKPVEARWRSIVSPDS